MKPTQQTKPRKKVKAPATKPCGLCGKPLPVYSTRLPNDWLDVTRKERKQKMSAVITRLLKQGTKLHLP